MAQGFDPTSVANWVTVGISTLVATTVSLVGVSLQFRRLKNEEDERSSFYEHTLFETRLSAYSELSQAMAELFDILQEVVDPHRDQPILTATMKREIVDRVESPRFRVMRLLLQHSLLFGKMMNDALAGWTTAFGVFTQADAPEMSPAQAIMQYGIEYWGVVEAMREELHFGKLETNLLRKLGNR